MDNATKRHPEKRKREQPPSLSSTPMNQNKKSEATPALMQVVMGSTWVNKDADNNRFPKSLPKPNDIKVRISPSIASFKVWNTLTKITQILLHKLRGWLVCIDGSGILTLQSAQKTTIW